MRAPIASFTRTALYSGVAATAMTAASIFPAAAQEQNEAANENTETIVVTGSLIARDPNVGAPVPIQSVTAKDLKLSGQTDIGGLLREIPALSTSVSAEGSVDSVFTGTNNVGGSFLNLRGLGLERTLVLVDGRRHVSGFPDEQSVDITTIPNQLIERVEVLTGGASAIYGADAVSGAVNFILKEDFEGLEIDASAGISDQGDGARFRINGIYGLNFADGRGNITISAAYNRQNDIRFGDRDWARNNGVDARIPNPDLRFNQGDISAASTPNIEQLLGVNLGGRVPSQADFIADYTAQFGSAPTLTAAETALFDRAASAVRFAYAGDPRFVVSDSRSYIYPGNFDDQGLDLNADGRPDCSESAQGQAGIGCWLIDDGGIRPVRSNRIGNVFTLGDGGDGIELNQDEDILTPQNTQYNVQVNLRYDFTPSITGFLEAKYVRSETVFGGIQNTFWDSLTIFNDNAYIPAELQGIADTAPLFFDADPNATGLYVTRDPIDLWRQFEQNDRTTYRIVGGVEGEFDNGWSYEVSANYGRFEQTRLQANDVYVDRLLAAVDAVEDPNTGEIVCRSDLNPQFQTRGSATGFPFINEFAYLTFTPGDGQCRPYNVFGGANAASQEFLDFVLIDGEDEFELEQLVFRAILTGDTSNFFETAAGPIGFAIGAEYRDESASSTFYDISKGIVPIDGAYIPSGDPNVAGTPIAGGTFVADVPQLGQNSLVFDPDNLNRDSGGSYDVWDVFLEVDVPLIEGKPMAEYLGIGGAIRYSDYSTVGSTTTWGANINYAPIESLRFRASYSKSVRAPNIFELFAPDQGAVFSQDIEPCEGTTIQALIAAGDPRGPIRQANCAADGIPANFVNPVTARFNGVSSGNIDLIEETSRSYVIGGVLTPTWLDGLTITVDYWNIDIEDAISAVTGEDIVTNCYDSPNFPNDFCSLFTRNRDPNAPQFLGLNFIRQTEVNFGRLQTSGVDFQASYRFEVAAIDWTLSTNWTRVNKLDEFFDPGDPESVDPELLEIQRPKWQGGWNLQAQYEDLNVTYTGVWGGRQGLRSFSIEDLGIEYDETAIANSYMVHNISAAYEINDRFTVYGGVNNLADREPFITEQAYPVSPLGRYFFLGVTANIF